VLHEGEFGRHQVRATPLSLMFFESLLMRADSSIVSTTGWYLLHGLNILRLIGVRFLLGWDSLGGNGVAVVNDPPVPRWREVKLLEISGSNVDGYYPNKIQKLANFAEILDFMESSSFDPSHVVVMSDEAPPYGSFVRPEDSEVRRTNRGIRVHARSQGMSLLVLPFEFSDCIDVQRLTNDSKLIWIGQGDLFLTALIFERSLDVDMEFRFGPFTNSNCRLSDIAGLRHLGLDSASFIAFKHAHPGKFDLDGQY
jgi:hypothetical protein